MNITIPHDIESFLMELKRLESEGPGTFDHYARTAGKLLRTKYLYLKDASLQALPPFPRYEHNQDNGFWDD